MIGDNNQTRTSCFNQFVHLLKKGGLIFNLLSSISITTTTSTTSSPIPASNPPITRLPDEFLNVTPSAAPDEEDLNQ